MVAKLNQNKVIENVLEHLSNNVNVRYRITEHPDEIERNLPVCDALAVVGSKRVAIEHTSIDSVPSQRRDDSRFIKVLSPLENELKNKLPTPGHYQLVVSMNAIPVGRGIIWGDIRKRIREWFIELHPL